jgi:hypothetical protein
MSVQKKPKPKQHNFLAADKRGLTQTREKQNDTLDLRNPRLSAANSLPE